VERIEVDVRTHLIFDVWSIHIYHSHWDIYLITHLNRLHQIKGAKWWGPWPVWPMIPNWYPHVRSPQNKKITIEQLSICNYHQLPNHKPSSETLAAGACGQLEGRRVFGTEELRRGLSRLFAAGTGTWSTLYVGDEGHESKKKGWIILNIAKKPCNFAANDGIPASWIFITANSYIYTYKE
jgi:hypothetical protein